MTIEERLDRLDAKLEGMPRIEGVEVEIYFLNQS